MNFLRRASGLTQSRVAGLGATGPLTGAFQRRELSFFSNLLGLRTNKLDKVKEIEAEATKSSETKVTDVKGRPSVGRGAQRKKLIRESHERIIGGNYSARGNPLPEKRLREWRHTVENLTLGPKKLNLVARLIRRLPVPDARLQLQFSKKSISRDVLLALDEACMKARQSSGLHIKDLIVGQCYVGGKIIGHKVDIKARGKSGRIDKRVSHLNIILYESPAIVPGFESKILPPGKYAEKKLQKSTKERRVTREGDTKSVASVPNPLRKGIYQPIMA